MTKKIIIEQESPKKTVENFLKEKGLTALNINYSINGGVNNLYKVILAKGLQPIGIEGTSTKNFDVALKNAIKKYEQGIKKQ